MRCALQQWGWTLARDPEGVRHWRPRARGVSIDSERGYRFRGRTAALHQIVAWLDRGEPDRRVLVVTGSPRRREVRGAGAGRHYRRCRHPRRCSRPDDHAVRASVGSVGCAVHAKARRRWRSPRRSPAPRRARLPERPGDLVPAIREVLEERGGRRFNVIIDALDEAASPAQARAIIDQVVAAARRDLLRRRRPGRGRDPRADDDGGNLLDRFGGALEGSTSTTRSTSPRRTWPRTRWPACSWPAMSGRGNPYLDDTLAGPVAGGSPRWRAATS